MDTDTQLQLHHQQDVVMQEEKDVSRLVQLALHHLKQSKHQG
jgi:hypothetical protein